MIPSYWLDYVPLPIVIATDIAGGLGSGLGVITALPPELFSNKKLIIMLGVPLFIGGIIGTIFLTKISAFALSLLLIIAISFLLLYMLFQKKHKTQNLAKLELTKKQYPLLSSIMLVLGVYSNVSGVGGGTFQKIAYTSILRIKVVDGIGINGVIYLPPTIFSLIVTGIAGLIAWPYLITLWVGTFIGSHFVAKHVSKIDDKYLRKLLMVLAFLYLIYLVWSFVH